MDRICGYVVVRRPEANSYGGAWGSHLSLPPPKIGSMVYSGVDRMQWFDVDQAIEKGEVPDDLKEVRQKAEQMSFANLDLVQDLGEARRLLSCSCSQGQPNEIVTVYSETVARIYGILLVDSETHRWIGWDAAPLAEFSLLAEGVYVKPSLFEAYGKELNADGLLPTRELALSYISAYRKLMKRDLVEEFSDEPLPAEPIHVGRIDAETAGVKWLIDDHILGL